MTKTLYAGLAVAMLVLINGQYDLTRVAFNQETYYIVGDEAATLHAAKSLMATNPVVKEYHCFRLRGIEGRLRSIGVHNFDPIRTTARIRCRR